MQYVPAFVSFCLEGSKPNREGKCLIKMTVYQKPNKKRYGTNFHVTKDEWQKLNSAKLRNEELKELQKKLAILKKNAEEIIEKIVPFSFVIFEEKFFDQPAKSFEFGADALQISLLSNLLADWFKSIIAVFEKNQQVGTASIYKTTMNSISKFKKNLVLHDITPHFLMSYEAYLKSEDKSLTTISIYMRNLRAIINDAIDAKILSKDNYPFARYEIPSGNNVKKALKNSDMEKLLTFNPQDINQRKALDFWLLSYLCNGMNFVDIILLKPSNITGRFLSFYRQKTIRTKKKDLRPIKVGLNQRAIDIINRWRNTDSNNPYLFPILEAGLSAKTIKNRCHRFVKWVNKLMYEIGEELGIEVKTSTYAARHTFSTVLKRKGVPISYIKDALGHSSVATTEIYLDSFEDDTTLAYADALTSFH